MEDLDTPRVQAGADRIICEQLEGFGLFWDGEICYQSQRLSAYQEALDRLSEAGHLYSCNCTRKSINQLPNKVYPGICRSKDLSTARDKQSLSIRIKTTDQDISIHDRHLPAITQSLNQDVGDFIVKRKDGLFAYQLAVVVDDAWQGITDVVRGADIYDSTPRQVFLQQRLQLPTPRYLHTPLVLGHDGNKLSKQNHAQAVALNEPELLLFQLLQQMGMDPPKDMLGEDCSILLGWALQDWQPNLLPQDFIP